MLARYSSVTDIGLLLCFLAFQSYCIAVEPEFEGPETSSADMSVQHFNQETGKNSIYGFFCC